MICGTTGSIRSCNARPCSRDAGASGKATILKLLPYPCAPFTGPLSSVADSANSGIIYPMRTPLIIAHRGDSSSALENSLEAFRLALAVPADMIELDLRMSRDGVLYVMHDRQTGRTADLNVDIESVTARELAGIRLRNGEPIPTLTDVFELTEG